MPLLLLPHLLRTRDQYGKAQGRDHALPPSRKLNMLRWWQAVIKDLATSYPDIQLADSAGFSPLIVGEKKIHQSVKAKICFFTTEYIYDIWRNHHVSHISQSTIITQYQLYLIDNEKINHQSMEAKSASLLMNQESETKSFKATCYSYSKARVPKQI